MKTEDGYRKIANVFVRCQPGVPDKWKAWLDQQVR